MGYEQVVPPIPDRKQEIEGLNKLENSWLNQSYLKYYMNESLRQPKMIYADRINKVYTSFWFNFILSAAVLAPVALFARRFFLVRKGVPVTYAQHYYDKFRPDNEIRRQKFLKLVIPSHLTGTILLAWALTDYQTVIDPYYEFFHKSQKMM